VPGNIATTSLAARPAPLVKRLRDLNVVNTDANDFAHGFEVELFSSLNELFESGEESFGSRRPHGGFAHGAPSKPVEPIEPGELLFSFGSLSPKRDAENRFNREALQREPSSSGRHCFGALTMLTV